MVVLKFSTVYIPDEIDPKTIFGEFYLSVSCFRKCSRLKKSIIYSWLYFYFLLLEHIREKLKFLKSLPNIAQRV